MTSASELFCGRRTRLGRGSEDLELESGGDLSFSERSSHGRRSRSHSQRRQSSWRHGLDGSVPVRRHNQSRTEVSGSSFMEGVPFNLNDGIHQYTRENSVEQGFSATSNRSRVTCSERLPGAVLQARERLLQRLRGAVVLERVGRRHTTNILNDELRLVDGGDWETDIFIRFSPREGTSASSIVQSEQCKKTLGLTTEVLNSLPVEIFSCTECEASSDDKSVSWDCSICLERFSDGNQLVCLPCSHRFHLACLGQWGLIRGDCPCCRRNIV